MVKLTSLETKSPSGTPEDKSAEGLPLTISELPTEILCKIFLCVRWSLEEDQQLTIYSVDYYGWIQACSHINRRWRNIAVGYPLLWTNPALHPPQLTRLMLGRSAGAPLSLDVDFTVRYPEDALSAINGHVSRIRTLSLWCSLSTGRASRKLLGYLSARLCNLEQLFINHGPNPGRYHSYYDDDDAENLLITSDDFPPMPLLRTIMVKGVGVAWDSQIFGPSVTKLMLSRIAEWERIASDKVGPMLATMPSLEELALVNACRDEFEGEIVAHHGVQLNRLKTLSIGTSLQEIGLLSDIVKTSPALKTLLIFINNSPSGNFVGVDLQLHRTLWALLPSYWTSSGTGFGPSALVVSKREISEEGCSTFSFIAFKARPGRPPSDTFMLEVVIEPRLRGSTQALEMSNRLTSIVYDHINCTDLTSLTLCHDLDIPAETLVELFGLLHITTVAVDGPCSASLIQALQMRLQLTEHSLPGAIPFAHLQYLEIANHVFDDWSDQSPMNLDELQECLQQRQLWQVPILRLVLQNCRRKITGELFDNRQLLREEIDSFKELVNDVHCC